MGNDREHDGDDIRVTPPHEPGFRHQPDHEPHERGVSDYPAPDEPQPAPDEPDRG